MKNNIKYIELPKLKFSREQGIIIYEFLKIVDKENIRTINEVRKEFKPIVLLDGERRGLIDENKILEKSKDQHKTPRDILEKFFDSEYSRLLDYCEKFDFISIQHTEISLTYLGSLLLDNCIANNIDNIFDKKNKDIISRIYIFIDNYKKWNLISVLRKYNGLNSEQFLKTLNNNGIGFDLRKIDKDSRILKEINDKAKHEWKASHNPNSNPSFNFIKEIKNRLLPEIRVKIQIRNIEVLLSLFIDSGIIRKESDKYFLENSELDRLKSLDLWNDSTQISENYFLKVVYEEYIKYINKNKNLNVALPLLSKNVCKRLKILWPTFDKIMINLTPNTKNYKLSFPRSGYPKKWGIIRNNKPVYYLMIKK